MPRAQRRGRPDTGPSRPTPPPQPAPDPAKIPDPEPPPRRGPAPRTLVVAGLLLVAHWALATLSLLGENMTVDEVIHLPAGLTYWQTGTFKLYPHNPPLIKLIAALPLLGDDPIPRELYGRLGWTIPNKAVFAQEFALANAGRYFELFDKARLLMPLFSVLGGAVVFAWSRRLYGDLGGLLSLALWCLCPNILAHARLVTTDVGATVLGFAATYLFWRYLKNPGWGRAAAAGLVLGLAQLAKYSSLLLYGLWPVLWLIHEVTRGESEGRLGRIRRAAGQGAGIIALSVLVINAGYGFEGTGAPLGSFRFTCKTLTVERPTPEYFREMPPDPILTVLQFRANRFKGTPLAGLPVPLPRYYVSGFDDQKLEAEGLPAKALVPPAVARTLGPEGDRIVGYPVYLDGELRTESWWYYYWMTLLYKVPEGTWVLVLLSLGVLALAPKARASWADEATLLLVPATVLVVMSFATNIALGLRYVLPIAPYVFASAGKLAPWAASRSRPGIAAGVVGVALAATAAATASIHPHYLAYFNWASGGPSRGSEHLIDSNLDWGQDLVNLRRWLKANAPDRRVGIAYFGQVNPQIFGYRGDPIDWFLPPGLPGTLPDLPGKDAAGPTPGLYAVSASLVRGLPWRVYTHEPTKWFGYRAQRDAFAYFAGLRPIASIGHSIFVYELTDDDSRRLAPLWAAPARATRTPRVEPGVERPFSLASGAPGV